jgi:hypothetical protein
MITEARYDATSDVGNAVTQMVLYQAITQYLDRSLVFNMDATQYYCETEDGKTVVHIHRKGDKKAVERKRDESLGIFIKEHLLTAADGSRSVSLYIVAIPSMGEEECLIYKVPYLSENCEEGFLMLAKSRTSLPKEAYKFMYDVWIPGFVNQQREKLKKNKKNMEAISIYPTVVEVEEEPVPPLELEEEEVLPPALFSMDGENSQIKLFLGDSTLARRYAADAVIVVKSPAATTSIFQAIDVGGDIIGKKGGIQGFRRK